MSPMQCSCCPTRTTLRCNTSITAFQYSNWSYYRTILAQNKAYVVEGVIEQFHPMPKSGHDTERFIVDGVEFAYSDYFSTPAFNNTRSHGGPLHEGLMVRIYFTLPGARTISDSGACAMAGRKRGRNCSKRN
jgi:hypothetical protein